MINLLPLMASLAVGQESFLVVGSDNQNSWLSDPKFKRNFNGGSASVCQKRIPLIFSPASLNFKDSDGVQTFSISLGSAPSGPVLYHLNGNNMRFDKCAVRFDQTNWNIPQVVQTIPNLYKGNDGTMKFNITATKDNGTKIKGYIPVVRYAMDAPVGSSSGDPHYKLFSGTVISQQKQVVNYLFKSPDFDVMAAQDKCTSTSKVYCNKAMVIRFGDSWFTYDSRDAKKDGSGIKVYFDGNANPGFIYSPPTTGSNSKKTYDFFIPDGSTVSVYPSAYSDKYGIHNTIKISLHPSMALKGSGALDSPYAAVGILVNADGTTGNSSVSADATKFFNSWAVPASSNFLIGQVPAKAASNMPYFQTCSITPTARQTSPNLPKYTNTWKQGTDAAQDSGNYSASDNKAAKDMCSSVFTDLDFCKAILDSKPFEDICFKDALLTKDIVIAQDHLEDYLLECAENVNSLDAIDAQIDKVMAKYGFGSIACPKNCSYKGECTNAGCMCATGFHGIDCSQSNLYLGFDTLIKISI